MTENEHDLIELLKRMRYDLTDLQVKVSNALAIVGAWSLPDPQSVTCSHPGCGARVRGPRTLAEHMYQLHGGPEPEHWTLAATRAALPAEPIEEEA